ncbi:MAG: hypothetical protein V9H26_03180 [Verrucomicrobiota bacterium]
MKIPKDEVPNMEHIRELARVGLPPHYRLKSVRCSYGSDWPDFLPDDFEIVIEYENHLEAALRGTNEGIDEYQQWAHGLVQDIRGDWPPESIRITFQESYDKIHNPS